MALFTPEELEELRMADAELDGSFIQTKEEITESRKRDREIILDRMDNESKKKAKSKRDYDKANKAKKAAYNRAYYEANREKMNAYHRSYIEKNREKWNAYVREYRKSKKAESCAK